MILSFVLFIVIGIGFGFIGAGGSILTVPILIYVLGLNTELAMSYSFYIVGLTACVGFLNYLKKDLVNFKDVIIFAIPSIIGVGISRYFILPLIPEEIFTIKKNAFLILFFAILMIGSATSMLLKKDNKALNQYKNNFKTIASGFVVGFVLGILGAGGGFLIIPALYNFLKIDIKKSIGTSLLIITLNCCVAIIADVAIGKYVSIIILAPILLASILGVIFGVRVGSKIDGKRVKVGFSIFTIFLAIFILLKELAQI